MNFSYHQEFPESLKTEWDELQGNGITCVPFLRFEYLSDWWQTRGGGEWPQDAELLIIEARERDKLMGIAPCFISLRERKRTLLLLGSVEISDYLDLVVRLENLGEFVNGLVGYIKTTLAPQFGIQRIEFDNLLDSSPALDALRAVCRDTGLDFAVQPLTPSPYIPLGSDFEAYMAGLDKKQRHEIRRKQRRVQELPEGASWYFVSDPSAIEGEIEDFLTLMAFEDHKAEFLTGSMRKQMRLSMLDAFNNGILQLAFITIGGKKAAAYLNFDFNNRIFVYNSGIDPQFYEHSPGWVLLTHLIQWAIENQRAEFDFMRGNEDYKYKFGAVDRSVMQVVIQL